MMEQQEMEFNESHELFKSLQDGVFKTNPLVTISDTVETAKQLR